QRRQVGGDEQDQAGQEAGDAPGRDGPPRGGEGAHADQIRHGVREDDDRQDDRGGSERSLSGRGDGPHPPAENEERDPVNLAEVMTKSAERFGERIALKLDDAELNY